MRNRKGEIATLLTLGLILVGGVAAIATSILTNNQKNIASSPRASTVNCIYSTSKLCMGECGTSSCTKCTANGMYRCPGTADDSGTAPATARESHLCPNSTSKFYYTEGGKYYMTPTSTTSYTSYTSICGSSSTSGCVGTAKYQKCSDINSKYTGGYYSNNSKYFEDSSCKKDITSEGVGNYCKRLNPSASTAPAGNGTTTPTKCGSGGAYSCDSPGVDTSVCKTPALEFNCCYKNGNRYGCIGTPCSMVGGSNPIVPCSDVQGTTPVNPGTGTGTGTQTGGSMVGPGESCCFTKKGLIYEYASYNSMVNNEMPLDCSRQTAALVKSYQALDPPGAFVCKTGSAGSSYTEPEPGDNEPVDDTSLPGCQYTLKDAQSNCGIGNYTKDGCANGKYRCNGDDASTPDGENLPACTYPSYYSAAAACGFAGFTGNGCKSGTYKCNETAINYGSPLKCQNDTSITYYKVNSRYYKSTSDKTGTTNLADICGEAAAPTAVNCKDPALYNSRDCGFLNSADRVCNKTSANYYFGIGKNTDTNYYSDSCTVLGTSKDQPGLSKALEQYCNCKSHPEGIPNAINPDSQLRALNGVFYQCKKIGTHLTSKAQASSLCTTCSSWTNSLAGHINCAITKEAAGDYSQYCCDMAN